jgi:hypothetical protein
MKYLWKTLLVLLLLAGGLSIASCGQLAAQTGLLQGGVTIGPIWPVETPGQNQQPVPPEVFTSRKIMVYDESGTDLIREVIINQIDQSAEGYYAVLLNPGTYTVDINNTGIGGGSNVPKQITISADETVTLNIDIDTGIR